ncbi:MAG: intracellular sulfur oxidation DsrE/DsrF family protein [Halioglobus sp.]|jgi:intracellular sulfur oxidation DsrE/DsrF family protein
MHLRLLVLALLLALGSWPAFAQSDSADGPRYIAGIELHTAEELQAALKRAEQLLVDGILPLGSQMPVAFVLHGPEVRVLLRQNYLQYKQTVDLAASLTALGVIEIKACETWMGGNHIMAEDLQLFVGTVPYAPSELNRLVKEESYLYF